MGIAEEETDESIILDGTPYRGKFYGCASTEYFIG
jgi:hypothetical protein